MISQPGDFFAWLGFAAIFIACGVFLKIYIEAKTRFHNGDAELFMKQKRLREDENEIKNKINSMPLDHLVKSAEPIAAAIRLGHEDDKNKK